MINLAIKRLFDIVGSFLALVFLLPVWIVIPIAIKLDSRGPVFFRQKRLTKDGRIFEMYKFRSMIVNAEIMDAGLFNFENDPRVTRLGRFLRNCSIDELPQLMNILKGDMAIIGPRPSVVYELGEFGTLNKKYKKRFSMKAGLTGLAQVKGRNDINWDEKVTLDNQYIDLFNQYGVLIDLKLIILSIFAVFRKDEIYEAKANEDLSDAEAAKFAEEEIIRIAHLPD
ncbi:sugar transferase [Sphaerochaeta globosa]|uniref:Undecaprenyl-phosphate galactose phosphotransferase n=1 Tax=Sphaerochaeta globosa (strain ATCC BAA-1886 / DSM 22777 / Buddy) TaxID=158189 RepID=F0RXS6_SPHGB|nr:sugar transferase [Sphaerochaeta globosa]ADY12203.1 Undecaprenyl-phosphate galactose phosphotransferase [Sphaerochaeta globosa str. Buddy]